MQERINRVHQKMEEAGLDGLLIESAVNRFYLTGFTGTAGRVLFTGEGDYFITDFRYTEQAGEQTSGYQVLEMNKKIEETISELLRENGVKRLGFEAESVSFAQYQKYREAFTGIELLSDNKLTAGLRVIKDSSELARIKKAVEITDRAFSHICKYLKPGISEREVALELEFFMKRNGAEGNAFSFIVASGKRGSLPHGVASEKLLEAGELITMDFGTVYQGYCSDMTRTVALGGVDQKQQEIYQTVLSAQLEVIEGIKAGMSGVEADAIAREIIKAAGYGNNFGHGLGHGIGVEIHENPRLSYTAEDQILEAGMIVTDEPGIYLPDWGGVRIEDDLLITEDGCEVLNSSPKELLVL